MCAGSMGIGGGFEGVAGLGDAAAVGTGEEVEVPGRAGSEVLGDERGAASQEKSGALGQAEE